ncbi:MAG: hypothetical protein ACI4DO_03555 [Roseburia sp.]
MEYKRLVLGVLSAVLLMTVSGCGEREEDLGTDPAPQEAVIQEDTENPVATETETTQEEETEEQETAEGHAAEVYGNILNRLYDFITNGEEDYDPAEGEIGVMEAIAGMESSEALSSVGYTIQDVSGDGIPELLIGEVENLYGPGNSIYAGYTIVDGEPCLIFEGWARNSYQYMGDGEFYYYGSGGAMYSIFGTYTISPDGTSLICNDYYFTYEKDESFTEIGFYHNTSGDWDTSVSEELDVTDEEFWGIETELESQVEGIELTPFSQYNDAE